jgi:glycine/D-amino acid oxidase-like deaminating enzyme
MTQGAVFQTVIAEAAAYAVHRGVRLIAVIPDTRGPIFQLDDSQGQAVAAIKGEWECPDTADDAAQELKELKALAKQAVKAGKTVYYTNTPAVVIQDEQQGPSADEAAEGPIEAGKVEDNGNG